MRTSFFAARRYKDLNDLNRQAKQWCLGVAMQRQWPEDKRLTVGDALTQLEPKLTELLKDQPDAEIRVRSMFADRFRRGCNR